jgi:hypothetical protein
MAGRQVNGQPRRRPREAGCGNREGERFWRDQLSLVGLGGTGSEERGRLPLSAAAVYHTPEAVSITAYASSDRAAAWEACTDLIEVLRMTKGSRSIRRRHSWGNNGETSCGRQPRATIPARHISRRSQINSIADRRSARHIRGPVIRQGCGARDSVDIRDSAGPDPREATAPEERSQARSASALQESVPLASLWQRRIHPGIGGFEYPRQEMESAALWSATRFLYRTHKPPVFHLQWNTARLSPVFRAPVRVPAFPFPVRAASRRTERLARAPLRRVPSTH